MALDSSLSRLSQWRVAKTHPNLFLAVHLAAAGALAAGGLWAFIAIAEDIPERGALVRTDMFVLHWFEGISTESGERVFSAVSLFGAPLLHALVIGLLLVMAWRRDWRHAVPLAFTWSGGVLLNNLLKQIFHRGRPEFAFEFIHHASWSFPSGHAMDSTIGYGFLTFLLLGHVRSVVRRRLLVGAAVVMIALIGLSRLYLGVHYFSDVAGGYLAGVVWLVACIAGYQAAWVKRWAVRSARS